VPTSRLGEPIAEVAARVRDAGWDTCVVVNEERIVFGLLRERELNHDTDEPVERFMRPGPSTFRPNVPIEEMAGFMTEHDLVSSPITSSDGRLIGLLRKDDAVRVTLELHGHHHEEEG
jgi:Mg/Co/Ni transporter MgtE